MTQLNEDIKLGDAKLFFPRFGRLLRKYGLNGRGIEDISLKQACEIKNINFYELIREYSRSEDFGVFNDDEKVGKKTDHFH